MLCLGGLLWVTISVQNVLLGDGAENFLNRLNLDLTSEAVLAFPHGNSKGEEHVGCVRWRGSGAACVVESTVPCPRFPVPASVGLAHCRSSNRFPRNVSKTLYFSHSGTIASFHSWFVGRGNSVLKDERKSTSERLVLVGANFAMAFEGRDARSAITLSTPATWTVMTPPTCRLWSM